MAARDLIPIVYLRECLSYDAETGVLRWRTRPRGHFIDEGAQLKWNMHWAHTEAGKIEKRGYRHIHINHRGVQRRVYAHRAAWALETGEWPPDDIAHDDLNRDNNRFKNLKSMPRGARLTPRRRCIE